MGEQISPGLHHVRTIIEKPKIPPTNLTVIAVYIFKPAIFTTLKTTFPDDKGEIQLTTGIQKLIETGHRVLASELVPNEKRIEIGTPNSYIDSLLATMDTKTTTWNLEKLSARITISSDEIVMESKYKSLKNNWIYCSKCTPNAIIDKNHSPICNFALWSDDIRISDSIRVQRKLLRCSQPSRVGDRWKYCLPESVMVSFFGYGSQRDSNQRRRVFRSYGIWYCNGDNVQQKRRCPLSLNRERPVRLDNQERNGLVCIWN
jgi:NDP-sugar pyrophosphorylase family protein